MGEEEEAEVTASDIHDLCELLHNSVSASLLVKTNHKTHSSQIMTRVEVRKHCESQEQVQEAPGRTRQQFR